MSLKKKRSSGFSLVQLSVLLTVASLVLIAVLPTGKGKLDPARVTATRMNDLMTSFRSYMLLNGGVLPCPADATIATGATNYGVAAANGGTTNNCSGSTPAANYVDATNHVAIGMVPIKTMGLSPEMAFDGWGRVITYAVDTNTTASCWVSPATGAISVTDSSGTNQSVIALVSHGSNGHGAFIPLAGTSGTAVRLNSGNTETNQLQNAHVDSSFNPTTDLHAFVKVPTTYVSTFDDIVVYNSPTFTMNSVPTQSAGPMISFNSPSGGYYTPGINYLAVGGGGSGYPITFTVTYGSPVTVSGTLPTSVPRLSIAAINVGGVTEKLNGGTTNSYYAYYTGGSGTNTLTFAYTPLASDTAPNGITVTSPIDLNGQTMTVNSGTINVCTAFTPPSLTNVIIPVVKFLTSGTTSWTVPNDFNSTTNIIEAIGEGGNGYAGVGVSGGAGGGGGAYQSIINQSISGTLSIAVGAGGTSTKTKFKACSSGGLCADYGISASGASSPNGGSAGNCYPSTGGNYGGHGGAGNSFNYGGGGGGGAPAGPHGIGRQGGNGATTEGGGGGGGGEDGGSSQTGGSGTASAGKGGTGGNGYPGTGASAGSNGASSGSTATGGHDLTGSGAGGGGSGGATSSATATGTGGQGSTYVLWTSNPGNVQAGPSGGGGGSGGINSTSGVSGNGGAYGTNGYGAGGAGTGGATGTSGTASAGAPGIIVITYR